MNLTCDLILPRADGERARFNLSSFQEEEPWGC